jgi:CspA family cold shock protein
MTSYKDVVTPSASASRLIGRVKWFNNKAGYGFITVTDGERSGSDIFVHHSTISVENQQYKYLVQGEYVEFSEVEATSGPHKHQASNVLGVRGGKLMCETRREFKIARSNYKTSKNGSDSNEAEAETEAEAEQVRAPRQKSVPREATTPRVPREAASPREADTPRGVRVRGEGPREGDKKEWTLVQKGSDKPRRATKSTRKPSAATTDGAK